MKSIRNVLPHVVTSAYIVVLSSMALGRPSLGITSITALMLVALFALRGKADGSLSPVVKGYLLYLAVNIVGFLLVPGQLLRPLMLMPASFLYASLLAAAALPPLFGGPHFTEYFARKTTPAAAWETDVFKKINRNMSWMWSGLFAASVVVGAIPVFLGLTRGPFVAVVFQVVLPGLIMLGLGVQLNKRYPGRYQRRMGIEPVRLPENGRAKPIAAVTETHITKEADMSHSLKVVVINGSPKAGMGNTSIMTQMMVPVLASEGIEVEEIFLAEKQIEFCVGCGVCAEKGTCWRRDDHADMVRKVLAADGLILASPVYFGHVTAQMKVFLDRSLAYGHKPRTSWKPGLAVSVSAGKGETATADYLAGELRVYGAYSVGVLTAIAVQPGGFLGKELVEARAVDLAGDLARAIREKRRYPATDQDLSFYLFMGELVRRQRDFMRDDYRHWENSGFYEGFESYVGQTFTKPPYDEEMRKQWIKEMASKEAARAKAGADRSEDSEMAKLLAVTTCRELIEAMPQGFRKEAAGDLKAVFQFRITGAEEFTAHLIISGGTCTFFEGPAPAPDVTITSPADVWLAISKGAMNGQAAFMSGKYRVEGNMALLMKLSTIFGV